MRLSARWLPMKPAPPVMRTRSGSGRGALASFTNASGAPCPFPFTCPCPFLLPFPTLRWVTPADLRAYDRRGWTARWIVSGNATMPTLGGDAAGQDHGTPSGLLPSSSPRGRAPRVRRGTVLAKELLVEGWQNEQVRGLVVAAKIGLRHVAREHHAIRETLPPHLVPYLLLRFSLPHQHEGSRRVRDRINQDRNSFVRTHAADEEDVRSRTRPAQRGGDLARALRLLQIGCADAQRQHLAAGAMGIQE